MSLFAKIEKVLSEKIKDSEKEILDKVDEDVKYKLDEDGNQVLDENGDPILDEEKDMDDEKDDDDEKEDDDDKEDKKDMKESLKAIFDKAKIDESVVDELETLFGVVVAERVKEEVSALEESHKAEYEVFVEDLETRVDKYISYVAEEWFKANEIAVESGIKVEISEGLIAGIKNVFEESYVEIPEDKVDIVAEAEETIDNLLSAVDEEKAKSADLQTQLDEIKSKKIVDELASDMTDTQREKLGTLIDSIEYKDDSDYTEKVGIVIENFFNKSEKDSTEQLDESTDTDDKDDRMSMYVSHLKKA